MKLSEIFSKAQKPFPSLEFVPPLKETGLDLLYETLDPLMEVRPPYVNITCHRGDTKHPSTVATAAAIMKRYDAQVVPHVICAGNTDQNIQRELFDLRFLGVENIMALRGDNCLVHADSLVRKVRENFGGSFCIGVAGYPEVHAECASLDEDIENLRNKVSCGADYIITQMFFDNSKFFNFVEKCRKAGITVPLIPGLKPLANKGHLEKLPETFSIELPEALTKEVTKCQDNAAARQVGIEWCVAQSRELVAHGVPAVHYYTMSKGANVLEILRQVF